MGKKVFIGVGHGGSDSGAVGIGGVYEKNINLSIALACKAVLVRHGLDVLLSREKDEQDTLTQEIAECNRFAPVLAVDIHNNAGGGDGFEVFHEVKGGVSKKLAKAIETQVLKIGQNSRGLKTKLNSNGGDWFGFIREVHAPSVLVECAFLDTKDIQIVDTPEECAGMGVAIAKGVLEVLGIGFVEVETAKPEVDKDKLYRVQVGAFGNRGYAVALLEKLEKAGFEGYIA